LGRSFKSDDGTTKELFSAGRDGKIRMFQSQYNKIHRHDADKNQYNQIFLKPMAQMDEHTDWVN